MYKMESITKIQLIKIMPSLTDDVAERYVHVLNVLLPKYEINTPRRVAHFLAQIAQESGELKYTVENLNYSAAGLLRTFRKYFPSTQMANDYARNPEKIANRVYANRLGNGDEQSGDGWKYRGRGLIQLTGKSNYMAYYEHLTSKGILVPSNIDELSLPYHAVLSACWFWQKNKINILADGTSDSAVCEAITRRVNGGTNGLENRKKYYLKSKAVFM